MKRAIRVAKNAFSESIQLRIKDDPKQFWKHVKRNGKEATSIPSLVSENGVVSDDEAKAEYFNRYFASVFSTVMPSSDDRRSTPREQMAPMGNIDDVVISTRGIELLLLKLNTAKGGGHDGFTNHFLKFVPDL
ncbi:hypothetical protein HPB49_003372 [Dermacentor silvarum]|uniref:Uncharacterized protein n=1 Tax=Dermacentor silvarum TaxID=543639 RepID=A0ACB8DTW1_DERSI|nr:hypothetical protein HPB49_003372 [Dermacentor silvarum]